jgi:hypothetical protein
MHKNRAKVDWTCIKTCDEDSRMRIKGDKLMLIRLKYTV